MAITSFAAVRDLFAPRVASSPRARPGAFLQSTGPGVRYGWVVLAAFLGSACLTAPVHAGPKAFQDPLEVAARSSPLAARSLLQGVARAGDRIVAVGQRGHIVVSSDFGATWTQAKVPVSSDLNAVFFVDARQGWAVGHDGVILATTDAGDTWTLQLDGRRANERLVEYMQRRAAESPTPEVRQLLDDANRYREQGADKPFLDVWFADASNGYAVGAYNLIFRTTDGGKDWQPWFDRTDNPKAFNLYAIRPAGDALYIAGEGGLVLKLDPAAQRFRALDVPYKGSFFGIVDAKDAVVVYGLRGTAFRSADGGATWVKVDAGLKATIASGTRTAAGTLVLADVAGRLAVSGDDGRTFRPAGAAAVPITGIVAIGDGRFVIVGPRGTAAAEIPSK